MAKRDLQREGGRFAEPHWWLVRYLWQETAATAERHRRTRGPMKGPATAIVHARSEPEAGARLGTRLENVGLLLLEVVFAEPWGDAGTMVVL